MTTAKSKRLLALDVFRGLTIAFMIIVNTPGSWSHIFPPLRHAEWSGWTPTDLVFPFFLFIVGVSMSFSLKKYDTKAGAYAKILKRTAIIFLIGLALNWFPFYDTNIGDLRIFGVLQRIALAYGIGALICINITDRMLLPLTLILLFFYAAILEFTGTGDVYSLETNGVTDLDLKLFGASHLYGGFGIPFDPEGLLSTMGAIANVMFGYFLGRKLTQLDDVMDKVKAFVGYGIIFVIVGLILDKMGTPINKPLWTSSYAIFTSGLAAILLGGLIYLIDHLGFKKGSKFFQIFGLNALVSYALSSLVIQILGLIKIGGASISSLYYSGFLQPVAGDKLGSLIYAITYMLLIWLSAFWLYRKKVFVKI